MSVSRNVQHGIMLVTAVVTALAFLTSPSASSAAAGGGGGGGLGGGGNNGERSARSPEKDADRSYRRGLRERDSAWKHEKKAEQAPTDKKRGQELRKAEKDWSAAVKYYRKAIKKLPRYPEAHSSLGYALRKLGDYEASLASYDLALKQKPGYPEALEYRAEAYLALGRLSDATRNYAYLARRDRDKAAQLLAAIDAWLEKAETEPLPVVTQRSPEWLRKWVDARKKSLSKLQAKDAEEKEPAPEQPARRAW